MKTINQSKVLDLLAQGYERDEIKERTGLSKSYICKIAGRHGYGKYVRSISSKGIGRVDGEPVPIFFAKVQLPREYKVVVNGKRYIDCSELYTSSDIMTRHPAYRVGYNAWH